MAQRPRHHTAAQLSLHVVSVEQPCACSAARPSPSATTEPANIRNIMMIPDAICMQLSRYDAILNDTFTRWWPAKLILSVSAVRAGISNSYRDLCYARDMTTNTDAEPAGKARLIEIEQYVDGIRAGNRAMLARAITLVESTYPAHQKRAGELLQALVGDVGKAHRVGITGVPGVGKSTTIDQLGINLVEAGHKVAVLAVDPTSTRSGGSILGDKTRMNRLAVHPNAYVRPSPTSGTLGGVAKKTRETMALVEAAGFGIVIIETVGVGQSEVTVADMVDMFLVLLLPGGGDELQGIKKGIIEIADLIAINKADGDNQKRAERAASEYRTALSLLTPTSSNWQPPVLAVSGLDNRGLDQLWGQVQSHRDRLTATGEFEARRQNQAVRWMHDMLSDELRQLMFGNAEVAAALKQAEINVHAGRLAPSAAVGEIMDLLIKAIATQP